MSFSIKRHVRTRVIFRCKGEEEQTHRHTVQAHIEENPTGSRLTYAEKEGVERGKKRRNGGRVIGGRGIMERSGVGWKGGRMIWGRGMRCQMAGRGLEGEGGGEEEGSWGGRAGVRNRRGRSKTKRQRGGMNGRRGGGGKRRQHVWGRRAKGREGPEETSRAVACSENVLFVVLVFHVTQRSHIYKNHFQLYTASIQEMSAFSSPCPGKRQDVPGSLRKHFRQQTEPSQSQNMNKVEMFWRVNHCFHSTKRSGNIKTLEMKFSCFYSHLSRTSIWFKNKQENWSTETWCFKSWSQHEQRSFWKRRFDE